MGKLLNIVEEEKDAFSASPQADIKFNFEVKEGVRQIVSNMLSKPGDADAIFDSCETITKLLDIKNQELLSTSPPEAPLVCRSGCSYCCAFRVLVTPLEVLQIVSYIKSNYPQSEINELTKRVEDADEITHGLSEEEYGCAHVYCPLLVNHQCSVYKVRPLECRGYSSMNVSACRKSLNSYRNWDVPIYKEQYLLFKSAHSGILESLLIKQNKLQLLELTSALKTALTTDNVIERWLSGEQIFADAEIPESDHEIKAFLPWASTF